jgi:polyisoprenoid-binding protein YceI
MRWSLVVVASIFSSLAHAVEAPLDTQASTLKFVGHTMLHDFKGTARDFHGSAQIDTATPALASAAEIDITAARLTTFIDDRDRKMFGWLQVRKNPDIEFQLGKVKLLGGDPLHATKAAPAQYALSGVFTLNKVGKPLKTEAHVYRDGQLLIADGTARIDTVDHGLPEVKAFFMTVDRNVDITFHLVFDLPKEAGL